MSGTARSVSLEPYLAFKFRVEDTRGFFSGGFNACTLPEHSIGHSDYSEGNRTYQMYYPGRSTFSSFTLSKGVFVGSSQLAKWIRDCAEGRNYRTDIRIHSLHRTDVAGKLDYSNVTGSRIYFCKNCMPIRFRPGSDFDALNHDVSIEEVEIQPEYFYVINSGGEVK